jgi:hypothetical protein
MRKRPGRAPRVRPPASRGVRLDEADRGVADDAIAVASRVARVAQVLEARRETPCGRGLQQPVDRRRATGLPVIEHRREREHLVDRRAIDAARVRIRKIVREVRTDDDQRLGPAPEPVEHLRDLVDGSVTDRERDQLEVVQQRLQEGQLHLERVLERMRGRTDDDLRQVADECHCICVDRDLAERGREELRAGQRESAHLDTVRRPEQHDASDVIRARRELRIGRRGNRTRVDIARVRRDQRLRLLRVLRGFSEQ